MPPAGLPPPAMGSAERMTIGEFGRALRAGEVSAESVTQHCLDRIAGRDGSLNACITVLADAALAQARQLDRELAAGADRGPLHGVPLSLKDLIDLEGSPTTAASRVRRGHIAAADAAVAARLRAAGAVFVCKTNLHEFAFGTTCEDSAFGLVRHPVNPDHSPGGSSGGSAVSVVAGMALASIGTDTGGSIRIPSAACGIVGLKPSFGEIPTDGVVPLSTTLDHVGPMTQSVADARVLYAALRGAGTVPASPSGAGSLRLGIPRGYFFDLLDDEVRSGFEQACERLRSGGAVLADVRITHAEDIAPVYLHIVLADAAAYHAATLDRQPDDYTANVRIRLEMGRYVLAEDFARAMRGREQLRRDVDLALAGVDALLLPSLPIPAPRLGAATVRIGAVEEPVRNLMLRLTQAFNVTGHPAISLPCGVTHDGLPIGAQLVGHAGATTQLLDVAEAVERYLGPGRSR